jgi:hypothetical protein
MARRCDCLTLEASHAGVDAVAMIISFDVKLLARLAVIDGPGFLTLPGRPATNPSRLGGPLLCN